MKGLDGERGERGIADGEAETRPRISFHDAAEFGFPSLQEFLNASNQGLATVGHFKPPIAILLMASDTRLARFRTTPRHLFAGLSRVK